MSVSEILLLIFLAPAVFALGVLLVAIPFGALGEGGLGGFFIALGMYFFIYYIVVVLTFKVTGTRCSDLDRPAWTSPACEFSRISK